MMDASSIEIAKNLAQVDINGRYYDFHNDFSCVNMQLSNSELSLFLLNNNDNTIVKLRFIDVNIIFFNFFLNTEERLLSLDHIFRVKSEINGELIDISMAQKGCFHLEFDEGQRVEFWSTGIDIENG